MIRRAQPEDAVAVSQALVALYHRQPASAERMAEMLAAPSFVLLLAGEEGAYVGYLHGELLNRIDGDRMLLVYDIAVAPEQRRRGIGTNLMLTALDLGREAGAARCWLLTEPDDAAACGLYEALGGDQWSAVGFGWALS